MKNKNLIIIIFVLVVILSLYFFIYTTSGSKLVADKMITKYINHEDLLYKNLEGNIGNGLTFENLEIKDIKEFPQGTTLKIQRLFVNLTSFSINGIEIEMENTRLRLPDSDPIVISGVFKEQKFDLNIFSKGFKVNEVLTYLPDFKQLIPIKGDVNEIDLFVTGHYLEPIVKGNFLIEKFVYKGFLLTNVPMSIDIQIKDIKKDVKLYGHVYLEKGELQTKRVLVKLDKSDLNFSGHWNQPQINFKGTSRVEKTKISIGLKGTLEKPELILSSEPLYPRQKLMIMLATGKSWQGVEDSIDNGLNSAALMKDFIDYFFFAGKSSRFAKRFGISDFSVKLDQNHKGILAKKELSEKLQVGYGIEQKKTADQLIDVSQKLEGEYKVNEKISVGLEREIKKKQTNGALDEQVDENNDKVFLKYKKTF